MITLKKTHVPNLKFSNSQLILQSCRDTLAKFCSLLYNTYKCNKIRNNWGLVVIDGIIKPLSANYNLIIRRYVLLTSQMIRRSAMLTFVFSNGCNNTIIGNHRPRCTSPHCCFFNKMWRHTQVLSSINL